MGSIKCIIAAGGLGTRLQGFRDNQSTKILLKVNSKSMILQQLEQLISWGLEDFIIITNPSFDSLIRNETSQIKEAVNISDSDNEDKDIVVLNNITSTKTSSI